jgi:hypothetical protein
MLTPLSFGWQIARALEERTPTGSSRAGRKAKAGAPSAAKQQDLEDYAWLTMLLRIIFYVGACAIFARANPKLGGPTKVLVYIAFLFVAELYVLYFLVRIFVAQVRQTRDYPTLAEPAPFFERK